MAVRPMDGTLVAIDGAPLPDPQKRRIIELLCAKQMQGSSDSQGWISLGYNGSASCGQTEHEN